jgi:hypothetical protein
VSVAGSGQSVVTDSRGQFALESIPVGSNRIQFDNGTRGSVNVGTERGMELKVAVALSGQNATVTCQANRPLGDTNVANACEALDANASGSNTSGSNTGGSNAGGSNTGGSNTSGNNTSGSNTGGSNTSGSNTSGNNTSGSN